MALSLKWNWRKRREAAGESSASPNLVFGGDVHVVWEKFCRYFDVEPRIVPLQPGKYTIGPRMLRRTSTRTRSVLLRCLVPLSPGTRTTLAGSMTSSSGSSTIRASTSRCTSTERVVASSGRSCTRTRKWDFRLEQVRSINVSGHKFGLVYPGIGWLIFREKADLAKDLVFEENYLGKTDATFTLNFSTGPQWGSRSTTTSSGTDATATPTSWRTCRRMPGSSREKLDGHSDCST